MSVSIHPSAVVDPKAELGRDVVVGPYTIIGPEVRLGAGVRIGPHVVIEGRTSLGEETEVLPFAMLGAPPGHLNDRGEGTELVVGARVSIREHVSLHRGTNEGSGKTVIGDDCAFLAHSHVGHDCVLEQNVLLVNGAMLGGHVRMGAHSIVGGNTAVHQFCRVGTRAILTGQTAIRQDAPPFCRVGDRGQLSGLNLVGLRRSGMAKETIRGLQEAYRVVFREAFQMKEAIEKARTEFGSVPEVETFLTFIEESKRGVLRHGRETT